MSGTLRKLFSLVKTQGPRSLGYIIDLRIRRRFSSNNHIVMKYNPGKTFIELSDDIVYDKYITLSQIETNYCLQINEEIGEERSSKMFDLFKKRAVFWLIRKKQEVIGYWWTVKSQDLRNWYILLNNEDNVFFAATIFFHWRGRQISPAVMQRIISTEYRDVEHIYLDVEAWNHPALRAWEKAGFSVVGKYPPLTKTP